MRQTKYPFDTKVKLCWLVVWFSLTLLGCQAGYQDLTAATKSQILPLPTRNYGIPAWLTPTQLAFNFAPEQNAHLSKYRNATYDLQQMQWNELPTLQKPEDCVRVWTLGPLLRMSDKRLSFVSRCGLKNSNERDSLIAQDPANGAYEILFSYPTPFSAGPFSFAPNGKEWIQENAKGDGLSNELYIITANGTLERLLPNFLRAQSPSWAPDNQAIAFFGTETYKGRKIDELKTWGQIEGLLRYPWDLYLMETTGQNPRIVLSGITEPATLKWAPQGRFLGFTGEFKGAFALWVFDTATSQLFKLRNSRVSFDWSPDGNQMILVEYEGEYPNQTSKPIIIDIPWDVINESAK